MELVWQDASGNDRAGDVPERLAPFVDAIGIDRTVNLILAFGGTERYFPTRQPRSDTPLVRTIGARAALALGREFMGAKVRVPLATRFVARYLRGKGQSVNAIARRLRRSDVTVRMYLRADAPEDSEK